MTGLPPEERAALALPWSLWTVRSRAWRRLPAARGGGGHGGHWQSCAATSATQMPARNRKESSSNTGSVGTARGTPGSPDLCARPQPSGAEEPGLAAGGPAARGRHGVQARLPSPVNHRAPTPALRLVCTHNGGHGDTPPAEQCGPTDRRREASAGFAVSKEGRDRSVGKAKFISPALGGQVPGAASSVPVPRTRSPGSRPRVPSCQVRAGQDARSSCLHS